MAFVRARKRALPEAIASTTANASSSNNGADGTGGDSVNDKNRTSSFRIIADYPLTLVQVERYRTSKTALLRATATALCHAWRRHLRIRNVDKSLTHLNNIDNDGRIFVSDAADLGTRVEHRLVNPANHCEFDVLDSCAIELLADNAYSSIRAYHASYLRICELPRTLLQSIAERGHALRRDGIVAIWLQVGSASAFSGRVSHKYTLLGALFTSFAEKAVSNGYSIRVRDLGFGFVDNVCYVPKHVPRDITILQSSYSTNTVFVRTRRCTKSRTVDDSLESDDNDDDDDDFHDVLPTSPPTLHGVLTCSALVEKMLLHDTSTREH